MAKQTMNFPMRVDTSGQFGMSGEVKKQLLMLFDFTRGERIFQARYGISTEQLMQSTTDFDEILPLYLIQMRSSIQQFIPQIEVVSVIGAREGRELVIDVLYRRRDIPDGEQIHSWQLTKEFNN